MYSIVAKLARGAVLLLVLALAACGTPEERARSHYNSGKELLASGDYTRARLELQNAVQLDEKLAVAWSDLATAEEKSENPQSAAAAFTRVVELEPANVQARIKLAQYQLLFNELDSALKNVNAANDLKKDDDAILALRASILFRLGDREAARADGERALAINPDNPDAHAVMAADLLVSGNREAALLFVNRGLSGDPNNLGLLLFKLGILEANKDDKGLEAVLRQIIAAHPKVPQVRQALLLFLADRKRFEDLETEMRAMLAAEPENRALALDLARLMGQVKGPSAARQELNGLIASHPDVLDYRLALVQLEFAEKNIDAAVAILDAIIAKGEPEGDVTKAKLQLASIRFDVGEYDEVKTLVDEILNEDAKNADGLALRAGLKLRANDSEGAAADLRAALDQRPKDVRLLVLLARAQEQLGNVEVAADHLGEAVKLSDYAQSVTLQYVSFLTQRGKQEQALNVLSEAVVRHPRDRELLSALGRVKLGRQDWAGAQEIAEAIKKLDNTDETGDQLLAGALMGQKKYDESIAVLMSRQSDAPLSAAVMRNIVSVYLRSGKAAEAEIFLQSMLATNPKNIDARILLGSVQQIQKRPEEAEATIRAAIELAPDNPQGYAALARWFVAAKKPEQAEEVLVKARAEAQPSLEVTLVLASLLEQKGDIEGAISLNEEQLTRTPDVPVIRNNLASLLSDHRDDEQSLARASELAAPLAGIDSPYFLDTLGWVAYRRGDYDQALENLQKAAEQLPENAIVRYHLGMTLLALKRLPEAKEQLTKAGELAADPLLKVKISSAMADLGAN